MLRILENTWLPPLVDVAWFGLIGEVNFNQDGLSRLALVRLGQTGSDWIRIESDWVLLVQIGSKLFKWGKKQQNKPNLLESILNGWNLFRKVKVSLVLSIRIIMGKNG